MNVNCKQCGKPTRNADGICDDCLQNEMHEMAQEMDEIYQVSGKDETVVPQATTPSSKRLVVLSFLLPLVGLILAIIAFSNHRVRAGRNYLCAALISYAINGLILLLTRFLR